MKFIGSMVRKLNARESITVPAGEFWKGSIVVGLDTYLYLNGAKTTQTLSSATLASGTVIENNPENISNPHAVIVSVLKFSEV